MKNLILILLILLSSCINKPPHTDIEHNARRATYRKIAQTCIDSLYHKMYPRNDTSLFKYQIHNVRLKKSKYFGNEESFHWGNDSIAYKTISANLENAYWHYKDTPQTPYLLKIDSVSITEPGQAFVRLLCVGQRTTCEYHLNLKNGIWHIDDEVAFDYEENLGPTIIK